MKWNIYDKSHKMGWINDAEDGDKKTLNWAHETGSDADLINKQGRQYYTQKNDKLESENRIVENSK